MNTARQAAPVEVRQKRSSPEKQVHAIKIEVQTINDEKELDGTFVGR